MDLRIGHLDFSPPPAPAKRTSEIRGIPPVPPLDALREMDRAAARADELWRDEHVLHFAMDEYSERVIVQVCDLEGRVLRTIPPSEALDVLSGRPL